MADVQKRARDPSVDWAANGHFRNSLHDNFFVSLPAVRELAAKRRIGRAIGMVLEDLLVDFLKEVTPGYEQLVLGGLILPPAAATMFVAIGLNNSEWRALWQPIHKSLHEAWKGAVLVSDRTRRRQTRTEPVFEHSDESPKDTEDGAIDQEVLEFKSKTSRSASFPTPRQHRHRGR